MKKISLGVMLAFSLLFAGVASAADYGAVLRGDPGPNGPSTMTTGVVNISTDGNTGRYELYVYDGNSLTDFRLHCAVSGQTGPVVATLYSSPSINSDGHLSTGSFDSSMINASVGASCPVSVQTVADLDEAIRQGTIYATIAATNSGTGLIHGNLTQGMVSTAAPDPMVATSATATTTASTNATTTEIIPMLPSTGAALTSNLELQSVIQELADVLMRLQMVLNSMQGTTAQ